MADGDNVAERDELVTFSLVAEGDLVTELREKHTQSNLVAALAEGVKVAIHDKVNTHYTAQSFLCGG